MRVAVLVDGAFFLRRWKTLKPTFNPTPEKMANAIASYCCRHLKSDKDYLYRSFYYDCPPLSKKVHLPVSGRSMDYSKQEESQFRAGLFEALRKKRKMALRLGYLRDVGWRIKDKAFDLLKRNEMSISDLTDDHYYYFVQQKGVDSRIACDIASLAFKRQVDKIVLIAGDADFVPAAKLARREGVDFVLDPLHHHINGDLHEHIDGCHSVLIRRPVSREDRGSERISGRRPQFEQNHREREGYGT